jgi:hypothetical protein
VGETEDLLRIMVGLFARTSLPEERVRKIVETGARPDKQLAAYNLCDGTKTQAEVAREVALDSGNFSRTVARWIAQGIVFRLGSGTEARLLHAYPLPSE